jgi:hypothetical protein
MSELSRSDAEHLYKILVGDLPICGCGNPETAYELVHKMLGLAPFYERSWNEIADPIGTAGACYIVLGALDAAGLMEHGGGIGGSWLTPKGEWCLNALNLGGTMRELSDRFDSIGFPHEGKDCSDRCWVREA